MKIVMIGPTYPYKGGISQFTTLLSEELSKENKITFYSWKKQYPKFVIKQQIDKKAKKNKKARFVLTWCNPLTWVSTAIKISKEKPDIIIYPWLTPFHGPIYFTINLLIKSFSKKTKIVYVCHNVMPHEKRFLDKILTKIGFVFVKNFIVHAREEEKILKKIKKGKINIILGFHPSLEVYKKEEISNEERENIRKSLGIKENEKVLLFFGFVRPYKGLKHLLKAMPRINAKLIIAGEFWSDRQEYFEIIERLGIRDKLIVVDRYVSDDEISKYFEISDIVVLPYESATQSGPLQIAYAFDKPVICTRVGGLKDVVEDGKTGYLIKPKDPGAIADAVNKFFAENKSEEFKKNIMECKKRFSWQNYAKLFERLI